MTETEEIRLHPVTAKLDPELFQWFKARCKSKDVAIGAALVELVERERDVCTNGLRPITADVATWNGTQEIIPEIEGNSVPEFSVSEPLSPQPLSPREAYYRQQRELYGREAPRIEVTKTITGSFEADKYPSFGDE